MSFGAVVTTMNTSSAGLNAFALLTSARNSLSVKAAA